MSTQAVDKDPWHYPRGELAAHILQALTLVDLIAIFAPRRKYPFQVILSCSAFA